MPPTTAIKRCSSHWLAYTAVSTRRSNTLNVHAAGACKVLLHSDMLPAHAALPMTVHVLLPGPKTLQNAVPGLCL